MVERKARRAGPLMFLADRGVVLLLGVGVGIAIGLAFLGHGSIMGGLNGAAPPPAKKAAAGAPAPAAIPLDCASPIPARLLAKMAAGRPITIGVFGDSFGDGMWAALYRRLGKENLKIVQLSQEGTGFTRYQVTNLQDKAAGQLATTPVDIAVISIGANDTQGMFVGPHAQAFMSPGWKAAYGQRMDDLVGLIRAQGAMVYWVGLPTMREPRYDHDIAALDDFQAQRMAALSVPYLSTRELSVDQNGAFNLYLPASGSGEPKLMRANDGIHMTGVGYERLAGPLIERLHAYLARAKAQAMADAPATASAPGNNVAGQ